MKMTDEEMAVALKTKGEELNSLIARAELENGFTITARSSSFFPVVVTLTIAKYKTF